MTETQKALEEWEQAAEHSKIPRISWKAILGRSLNAYTAERLAQGSLKKEIIAEVVNLALGHDETKGWHLGDIKKNAGIGVSAIITHFKMEHKAYNKGLRL